LPAGQGNTAGVARIIEDRRAALSRHGFSRTAAGSENTFSRSKRRDFGQRVLSATLVLAAVAAGIPAPAARRLRAPEELVRSHRAGTATFTPTLDAITGDAGIPTTQLAELRLHRHRRLLRNGHTNTPSGDGLTDQPKTLPTWKVTFPASTIGASAKNRR
jgi:hypothetical protein